MNKELLKVVNQLYDLCKPADIGGFKFTSEDSERLRTECINFLSYLSASDGTISDYEAKFIGDYFSYSITANKLKEYIENNHTYTTEFENTVPLTFKLLLKYDNSSFENNGILASSNSEAYIKVFECLGKEFLVCDGEATSDEIENFTIYTNMLKNYKKQNAKFSDKVKSSISVENVNAGEKIPVFNENGELEESLDDLLDELNSLIGLQVVKDDVTSLIHLQEIKRLRIKRGLKEIPVSNHLVFYGNPGTGKTTVARLLARIYHTMGILSKGQLIEVDRSGLVAGYVGQTALKVQEVVEKALGGILFYR